MLHLKLVQNKSNSLMATLHINRVHLKKKKKKKSDTFLKKAQNELKSKVLLLPASVWWTTLPFFVVHPFILTCLLEPHSQSLFIKMFVYIAHSSSTKTFKHHIMIMESKKEIFLFQQIATKGCRTGSLLIALTCYDPLMDHSC